MHDPLWVANLAAAFWAAAGGNEPFPRNLRRPIARALPLGIVSVPRLRLRDIRDWFVRTRQAFPCNEADRGLRACLVAHRDHGYVFLDGADAEDEQRMSLAHETGHFLRHYWHPRREAARRLGEQVLDVFDGRRPPTLAEEFHSLVAEVKVGFHVHLMSRDSGQDVGPLVAAAEWEADRLGYELLAPTADVLRQAAAIKCDPDRGTVSAVLHGYFGLPKSHAIAYAAALIPQDPTDPLLGRLGLAR